jgi:uncharacterized protein DUF551
MKWIKCSDRFPEEATYILTFSSGIIEKKFYEKSYGFYSGEIYCYSPVDLDRNVTHWMPLPEKPDEMD